MNNCYCKSSLWSLPFLGGYVDFENAQFYKENFNVQTSWAIGATIGGLIPFISCLVAMFWWLKCKHLWSANEITHPHQLQPIHASMEWLR